MHDLLKGVRIVDLSTIVLGPYATQLLADFGADVIKVEPPGGDLFRAAGATRPGGDSAGFLNCNRNKRSIVLDLADDEDRAILLRLAETADVFVHNMRPAAAAKLRIGYDDVRAVRPDIVYCSARGYGAGPLGDEPAYDDCIQAASGVAALNADASGAPRYVPTILCDKIVGLHLALAIASGIASRARTGDGAWIETPMFESMVAFLMVEQLGGESFDPPRGSTGYERLASFNRRPYATRDGYITIMPYTAGHWQKYLALVGEDALAGSALVTDSRQRSANIDMLYGIIARESPARGTAEWLDILRTAQIPCAPVNRVADLLQDSHLTAVGMFEPIEHPGEGRLRAVRSPYAVHGRRITADRPAPVLGADSGAILADLGITHPSALS